MDHNDHKHTLSFAITMARTGRNKRRRVQVVDSADSTHEPEQLHWFGNPAQVTPAVPAPVATQIQIEPALFGLDAHLNAQQYEGDHTAEEVIEHVNNSALPVYGKVIFCALSPRFFKF